MKRKIILPIFLVLLFYLIFSGCAQRKNPLQSTIDQGGIFETSIDTSFTLINNVLDDPFGRTLLVYLPPGYQDSVRHNYKFPVLILLHGFKENETSYDHYYKIKTTADQMISTGEIQPMVIVMPDGSGRFGGSFFTNSVYADSSVFAGKYEDYVTREMFNKILYDFGTAIRGVSYKTSPKDSLVFRDSVVYDTIGCKDTSLSIPNCPDTLLVIDTTNFLLIDTVRWVDTTISIPDTTSFVVNCGISGHGNGGYGALRIATDYPLIFGSVSAMSAPLDFASLLNLVPAFMDSNGVNSNGQGYHSINPDPDSLDRLSSLFFAMAVAFSPHELSNSDHSTFFKLTPEGQGVDLPFDSLGNPVQSIWRDKWLAADLKTRISNLSSSDTSLRHMSFYIDCGDQDEFGFAGQAQNLYNVLVTKTPASNVTLQFYSGYPGYPALENSFIYDRLREVLKFHSDHFTAP
ncbi:MAG TPA: alpha/beta hydrolase-fold protein [Terriglobales bacterium]|nr:alpha/beta hydrolase-fold protein [Terriglobales bacterium]